MENENVKEKLNSLIQKKLSEQSPLDSCDSYHTAQAQVQIKQEHFEQERNGSGSSGTGTDVNNFQQESAEPFGPEERFKHISLHEVLNEKKKALLRNPDIIELLLKQAKS